MWAMPLAPPPLNTTPTLGRSLVTDSTGMGEGF
jgi:hypothetical protein